MDQGVDKGDATNLVKTAAFVRNCIVSMIQEPFSGRFQDDCLTYPVPECLSVLVNLILQGPSCVQPGDEINKQRSNIAATISQLIIHNTVRLLPAAERLLRVFERLTHPELLERCSLLGTLNANKCLHSVVWRRAPKTRSTVEIAVALGVVQFNCGGRVLVDAANSVVPGSSTDHLAVITLRMDNRRLRQAMVAAKETLKTSRKRLTMLKLHAEEELIADDGNVYSPLVGWCGRDSHVG